MKRPLKRWLSLFLLLVVIAIVNFCYLTYNTYGNWPFALALRGKKLLAFIFVGIAAAFSAVSFQTAMQNHFLTPNISGMGSLYVFMQTVLLFLLGGVRTLSQVSLGLFLMDVFLVVFLSTSLSYFLLRKSQSSLFLLLMIGMILGTFFNSTNTFLQVITDPNEYDLLQGELFASSGSVNNQYLISVGVAVLIVCGVFWRKSYRLDVLHLRNHQAQNLEIAVSQFQLVLLCPISSPVGLSVALVGPITFSGFIVANMSYQLMKTCRHRRLSAAGSLIAVSLLMSGQLAVEQVLHLNTPLSVVIQFVGSAYFIRKIIAERKQRT